MLSRMELWPLVLLNCLRVSLIGFSSFCSTLSMMRLTLSGGSPFCKEVV